MAVSGPDSIPGGFRHALYDGVLSQFAVVSASTHEMLGLVVAYNESREAGHCYIGFQRVAAVDNPGTTLEGLGLLVDYLFTTFPFRKIFAELPEYNLGFIASIVSSLCKVEGKLEEFYWYNGELWDQYILSISRSDWDRYFSSWASDDVRRSKDRRGSVNGAGHGADDALRR